MAIVFPGWLQQYSPPPDAKQQQQVAGGKDEPEIAVSFTATVTATKTGRPSRRRGCYSAAPPSSFSRCFNMDAGDGMSVSRQSRRRQGKPGEVIFTGGQSATTAQGENFMDRLGEVETTIVVGETVILLHPHLPSLGVSKGMERGRQQIDSLADG